MEYIELPDFENYGAETSPTFLVPTSRIVSIRLELPDPETYTKDEDGSSVHDMKVGYDEFVEWMSNVMREVLDGQHETTDPLLLSASMTVEVMMEKESVLFEISDTQMTPVMQILDSPNKEFGLKVLSGYLDLMHRLDDFNTYDEEDLPAVPPLSSEEVQ